MNSNNASNKQATIVKAGIGQFIIVNSNGGMVINRYFDKLAQAQAALDKLLAN